jgi:predicted nucleotide-binding protein
VIRDVLDGLLGQASLAVLVMTGEDESPDGTLRARQNVIHEIGLFQGRLGFTRAIALVEEGVETFSNLQGVNHVKFACGHIDGTVGHVLATIRREVPD